MNFKKVYIAYPDSYGGVQEVCLSLESGFLMHGVEVERIHTFWKAFKIAVKLMTTNRKDLLITNLKFGSLGLFAKYSIFIIHGFPMYRVEGFFSYYVKFFFHFFFSCLNKKTIAVSYLTRYICENHFGIKIDQVVQNPLPVNFKVSKAEVNAKEHALLFMGRIVPSKGLNLILDALKLLREQYDLKVKFHIVGSGPLLARYKELYNDADNIFHGYVNDDEKNRLIYKSSAFISLSEGEPFGLTALEASCANIKCILPTYGGHQEFVPKNLLYTINDIYSSEEIATVIFQALTNKLSIDLLSEVNLKDIDKSSPFIVSGTYLNIFGK